MTIKKYGGNPQNFNNKSVCFDDVLLEPQHSNIRSRSEVDIGGNLLGHRLDLPIISSPMDTVTEETMCKEIRSHGGLGILHRYNSIDDQQRMIESVYNDVDVIGAAVGVTGDYLERSSAVVASGASVLCVDIAHGHHVLMERALKSIKDLFGDTVCVIAGNVATLKGFNDLSDWGADAVKIGIGGGSICSTRIQTGHGMPTLQSILECSKSDRGTKLIADGGIKNSGDIVKSLAAGADFVMLGSLLAGTDEAPGDLFEDRAGKKYKAYRGMASHEAQMDWRGSVSSLEGVATTISYKGPVSLVLRYLEKGIRSGFSYSGARNLAELQARCKFLEQTSAGQLESSTHILR